MYIIRAYDEQSNGYFVQLNHLHKTIKTSPSASESYKLDHFKDRFSAMHGLLEAIEYAGNSEAENKLRFVIENENSTGKQSPEQKRLFDALNVGIGALWSD